MELSQAGHAKAFYQLFQNSSNPVFAIDGQRRICFWNDACEELMGRSFQEVKSRTCYSVMEGMDVRGNPFCGPDCDVAHRVERSLPVKDYDMAITNAEGDSVLVNVGAYSIPKELRNGTDVVAFLSLRRVDCYRFLQRMESGGGLKWAECRPEKFHLTPREMEILKMASNGVRTAGIAEGLSISTHTVKNHFKNILSKLDVHSRTEAVSLALRMNFF
jgi:DNA-binding CsgD family transcriptional regulator